MPTRTRRDPGNFKLRLAGCLVAVLAALSCCAPLRAQYLVESMFEPALSKEEQERLNRVSLAAILGLNSTNNASIPLGFLPAPAISATAEFAGIAADNGLKFTKAVLRAPADRAVAPNSADGCSFDFDLPQAQTTFENLLGLWPKLGNDALFRKNDEPISFGELGVPEIVHANTDVLLTVSSRSAGIDGELTSTQHVVAPAGVHEIEWRADTKWYPIWDLSVPIALAGIMLANEFKYSSYLDKVLEGDAVELASVKNSKQLAKILTDIDRKTGKTLTEFAVEAGLDIGHEVIGEFLVERFFDGLLTVSRSRIQKLTVYDVFPPTITTTQPHLTFEATDIGGARTARYLAELQSSISASDQCHRHVVVGNDAPDLLPLGDTVVTWTVRDDGPATPKVDHDGDGTVDDDTFWSRAVAQTITVKDTQAPLLVAPPAIVVESPTSVALDDQALGQPLVVDLADLHPDVSSAADDAGALVSPDTRAVVTWTAADHSVPPNRSSATQLVTVKTPGTNTAPSALPRTAQTLTSQPVDIVLSGVDSDVLPIAGGAAIVDPLSFRIEQRPQHGEFVAPLHPFFIDDYRTDKVGGLNAYIDAQPNADTLRASYEHAVATNGLPVWLDNEFCAKGRQAPVDFVFDPQYIQVTDDGQQYYFDSFFVCDPDVDTPWAVYPRISRWDRDNAFLGHVRLDDNGGGGISPAKRVFRIDRENFLYYVNESTGGEPVVSVQRCPANLTNTTNHPPFCQAQGFGPIDSGDTSNNAAPETAYVDIARELVYVTAGRRVDVFDYRLEAPGTGNPTRKQVRIGTLVNDAGAADFRGQPGCSLSGSGGFDDAMEVDSAGNFYVIDNACNRIHKFTPSHFDQDGHIVLGSYVGWMGKCTGSNNLACDVAGLHSKGYSCTAAAACAVPVGQDAGNLVGQFSNPAFLAIDPNDVLYVADYANQRIQRFAPDGTFAGQAKSTGNGVNAQTDGSFVLGNMGPPKHVTVNSRNFFVVDQSEHFVHVFDTSPFKDVTDSSATVSYVSAFDFHSATDTFTYSVNDGLVASSAAQVSVAVARNYRQPLPTPQTIAASEDHSAVIVLSGSDPDGIVGRDFNGLDTLTFAIARQPEHGTLIHQGNPGGAPLDAGTDVWTYVPNRDFHGADSFTFTVRDAFTGAQNDGAREIPQPYGEAAPAVVSIDVASVNDIPIVRMGRIDRVAAGFPMALHATGYDDLGDGYEATVRWGDGTLQRNGETRIDRHGTPNDASDDTAMMTGVVFSAEALSSIGQSPLTAEHTYGATGTRAIELCLRDPQRLETCSRANVTVQHLVSLGAAVDLSAGEITDGVPFDATIDVVNGAPSAGVAPLAAAAVELKMELPPELVVRSRSTTVGSCSVDQQVLHCGFGTMASGAKATVTLSLRGNGRVLSDRTLSLQAEVTTATPALADVALGGASIKLAAARPDRDGDGLSNIFEGVYGVSDPAADDDGDGLSSRRERDAETSPIAADTDGDGIPDGAELDAYGSDPLKVDSDGDGLGDGDEVAIFRTDPHARDSDGDGLPDDWELDHGFDPLTSDGAADPDLDGLSDAREYEHGTDYVAADSDGDTLLDGAEVDVLGTDPTRADSDDDGLNDDLELLAGTNPLKPDSDDDGLLDGAEVHDYMTNPLAADTDQDGLPDGWEVRNGRNPLVPVPETDPDGDGRSTVLETAAGTDPFDPDTDRDGLADGAEIAAVTDALDADSDDDGLLDGDELAVYHTSPLVADTDGDGSPDGWEVEHGLSPTVSDGASDPDGDGLSNDREYANGTDPNDDDSDGDGIGDRAELAVLRYEDSGQLLGSAIGEAVELGDLDGDGDLDAFVANRAGGSAVWTNDGKGTYTRSTANTLNALESLDVALADVDGDGDLDAVLAHPANANTLWLNGENGDAQGVFRDSQLSLGGGVTDGLQFGKRFSALHGGPALYVANYGADDAYAFNNGALVHVTVGGTLAGNSEDVAVGDLNGDGFDDAFIVNRGEPNQVFIATPPTLQDSGQRLGGNAESIAVALGDLDGDGDLDAFEVTFGGGDRVWRNDGQGHFTDSGQVIGNDGGNEVKLFDVDGDGDFDALVANTGVSKLWLNSGGGTMIDSGQRIGSATSFGLAAGDVDGDGDTDAFFANDGGDTVWLLNRLSPTTRDSDGDGADDGWELAHGFDPLSAADGDLDTDLDGLLNKDEFRADTDPRDADTDGDGMPDKFEVDHGLDPKSNDGSLDLEADGRDNLTEYRQGSDPAADDAGPLVTPPPDVAADSTGALTAVPIGAATAVDARDGPVTVTAVPGGPFAPGRHDVVWSASDVSGNVGHATQHVDVTPRVDFGVDEVVDEGGTAQVLVQLNGPAVTYPVRVDYSVAGAATNPEDHDAASGSVSIASGTTALIPIHIVADHVFEGPEPFTLTIEGAMNAVPGSQRTHTVTISQANVRPTARIVARQRGKIVTTAAVDGGPVEISAVVTDPNAGDRHVYDWSTSDAAVLDPGDYRDEGYVIDPAALPLGIYRLVVRVTDDGAPVETNTATSLLRIGQPPALGATDSDGDGRSDAVEGSADADDDGVPDYLDASDAPNVLLVGDRLVLETQPGLTLRLGEQAFARGAGAGLPESAVGEEVDYGYPNGLVDFEILGVEPGNTARVVVPLSHPIPRGAVYRKHVRGSWSAFVVDATNTIASAPGSAGACPATGSPSYVPGLNAGDACVEMLLTDGGPNDADGVQDGVIRDPGGVAVPVGVTLEVLPPVSKTVSGGTAKVVALALRLTSDSGDVELRSLTVKATGNGDDRKIAAVRAIVDANGNGVADGSEIEIARGTFSADDGTLTLRMPTRYAVPAGRTDLLVTYDF